MGRRSPDRSAAPHGATDGTRIAPERGARRGRTRKIVGRAVACPDGKDSDVHEFDLDDGTQKRPPWWFKAVLAAGLAGAAGLLTAVIALNA